MALRYRLAALIRDPDPASRSLQVPLFPADGTVILDLTMLGTEISRKRQVSARRGVTCSPRML